MEGCFLDLFIYGYQYVYGDMVHAFVGCKLKQDLNAALNDNDDVDEVLVNFKTNTMKLRKGEHIYVCRLSATAEVEKVKGEADSDSDFEEDDCDESSDDTECSGDDDGDGDDGDDGDESSGDEDEDEDEESSDEEDEMCSSQKNM